MSDSITTANRYIEKFRKEYSVPDQTAAELKATKNELKQTVAEIRASSQKEIEYVLLRYLYISDSLPRTIHILDNLELTLMMFPDVGQAARF